MIIINSLSNLCLNLIKYPTIIFIHYIYQFNPIFRINFFIPSFFKIVSSLIYALRIIIIIERIFIIELQFIIYVH